MNIKTALKIYVALSVVTIGWAVLFVMLFAIGKGFLFIIDILSGWSEPARCVATVWYIIGVPIITVAGVRFFCDESKKSEK